MSDEEYKKMLKMYSVLERIMDKYIKEFSEEEELENTDSPIMIPTEIYDEICYEMGTDEIGLMGIS
tara:strand:+ start:1355 stop:1552 length:198 start_codon:yes stop_codon:yes gene_type:complete